MQFTRICLKNWRNFRSVDVPLRPRTFVLGANASGKSNFFNVFRFLRTLARSEGEASNGRWSPARSSNAMMWSCSRDRMPMTNGIAND